MASPEELIAATSETIAHDHSTTPDEQPQGWLYKLQGRITVEIGKAWKAKVAGKISKLEYDQEVQDLPIWVKKYKHV